MTCDLKPTCNIPFGFFTCNLPEDTNDVDITVHTLKVISFQTKTSPFAKRPKATPVKRRNIEKLFKPRKVNVGFHPGFVQKTGLQSNPKKWKP